MKPVRIFPGREVLLPGYFAEYRRGKNEFVAVSISREEFDRWKARGVRVTGWYVHPQTTLDEFLGVRE